MEQEKQTIKIATDVASLYAAFDTQKPLNIGDKDFHIEIFEDVIDNLRMDLELNQEPYKSFYITGQVGNGKSTALNFIANDSLTSKYKLLYLNGRDIFKPNDTDIIDVLLSIAFTIFENDKSSLLDAFTKQKLEEFKSTVNETLAKEEQEIKNDKLHGELSIFAKAKALMPIFSFGVETKAKYNLEVETKTTLRKIFKPQINELLNLLNEIVDKYAASYGEDKQLLLIIDDLEKLTSKEQIKELFVQYGYIFNSIHCVKVITFPIYLTTQVDYLDNEACKFSLRISGNKLENIGQDEISKQTREKLKELIYKRSAKKELIDEDAAQEAITKSGANPRQLMEILQKAARFAYKRGLDATLAIGDVIKACDELQNARSGAIPKILHTIKYVKDNNLPQEGMQNEDAFFECLKSNYIFVYFNGTPWYEINPVIEKVVETYAKKIGI